MPDTLLVETRGRVGLLTLNRPEARNAIDLALARDLVAALEAFDHDEGIGASVVTGSERAFAAGADIREMAALRYPGIALADALGVWDGLDRLRKPVLAAVASHALGGGCELALACDLIIAADTARFGLPEIRLGIIPGIGGTQRLVHAVGKAKAMEMVLTGRTMDAAEAERAGLVARVVPAASLLDEALAVATTIAGMALPAVLAAKDCVDRAFEGTLAEGLRHERQAFYALFATEDQREGMQAFLDKRPPAFRHG